MMKRPTVISVFSGAGGIDIGFQQAGFNVLYSTDFFVEACETIKKNDKGKFVECADIRSVSFKEVKKKLDVETIDCVVGGPPCPAYSKSRFYLKNKKRALEDENSFTLKEYFRAIEELSPKVYFFENVHGFVYKPHFEAVDFLKSESKRLGYKIFFKVVNAADYGVPQTRERFICIGVKNDYPDFKFPQETHCDPQNEEASSCGLRPWVTCQEAIGDLDFDLPEDNEMQAGSKDKDLLKGIPPGENYLYFTKEKGHPKPVFKWRSRYWSFLLKLSPHRPSWTIQASHSNNMGPFHWKNRFLRISEIKRIQTFDDNYEFIGDFKNQWRQIGNAVPPKLVKTFANAIMDQIFRVKKTNHMLAKSREQLLPI